MMQVVSQQSVSCTLEEDTRRGRWGEFYAKVQELVAVWVHEVRDKGVASLCFQPMVEATCLRKLQKSSHHSP